MQTQKVTASFPVTTAQGKGETSLISEACGGLEQKRE